MNYPDQVVRFPDIDNLHRLFRIGPEYRPTSPNEILPRQAGGKRIHPSLTCRLASGEYRFFAAYPRKNVCDVVEAMLDVDGDTIGFELIERSDGGATKSGHAAAGDSGDSGAAGLWAGPPPATEPDAGHQNLGTPASEPVAAAQPEPAARPGGAAPTGRPGTPVQPEPDFIFSHHHSPGARTACGLSPGPNPFGDDARHSPEANASAGTPD